MIYFKCKQCGKKLKAKPEAAGKRCRCTGCEHVNIVSETTSHNDTETVPQSQVRFPELVEPKRIPKASLITKDTDTLLTPCHACARMIAKTANVCPGCGALNNWVHPEIARFMNAYYNSYHFSHLPPFEIEHDKDYLYGYDVKSYKRAESNHNMFSGLSILTPLNLTGLFTQAVIQGGVTALTQTKIKYFRISFKATPPVWETSDVRHWKTVLDFFGIIH